MNESQFSFSAVLIVLLLLAVGWLMGSGGKLPPIGTLTPTPTPTTTTTTSSVSPTVACPTDGNTRQEAGVYYLKNYSHYAQIVLDPTEVRYARVLADGNSVEPRFDAGSVGPIVYRPTGDRLAFVASLSGTRYIFVYASNGGAPLKYHRVDEVWKNKVCYGDSGKAVFAIARHNSWWYLEVRDEVKNDDFQHRGQDTNPSNLENLMTHAGSGALFQ